MSHPTLNELLTYMDGELASHAREQVALHLESCAECRAQLSGLSATSAAVSEGYAVRSEESREEAARPEAMLRARLAEMSASSSVSQKRAVSQKEQKRLGLHWSRSLGYVAALLVLTALGGVFVWHHAKVPERAALPNPAFTPGATRQVSLSEICAEDDDEVVRVVPAAMQQKVFYEYGLKRAKPGDFEVDYLITPGLGGSDDVANLWPQPHASRWNSYVKDQLEDHLHHMVCHGQISLADAQRAIASNWIDAYKRYFNTEQPLARGERTAPAEARVQRAALWRKQPGL